MGKRGWKKPETKFLGLIFLLRAIPDPRFLHTQLLGNPFFFSMPIPLIRICPISLNFIVAGDKIR